MSELLAYDVGYVLGALLGLWCVYRLARAILRWVVGAASSVLARVRSLTV